MGCAESRSAEESRFGGGTTGGGNTTSSSRSRSGEDDGLSPADKAVFAAMERAEKQMSPAERERHQKDFLIGQIEALYKLKRQDAPFNLRGKDAAELKRMYGALKIG